MKSLVPEIRAGVRLIIALLLGTAASAPAAIGTNEMPVVWDHTFHVAVDPSWRPNVQPLPGRKGILLGIDRAGKILVFSGDGIRRLNGDGSNDPSFPTVGLGGAVAFDSADRILFTFLPGGPTGSGLRRLNPDGSLDTTFAPARDGGLMAVQSDNRVLVLSDYDDRCCSLSRLNVDGSLDETFHAPETPDVLLVRTTPDERVLVISRPSQSILQQPILRLETNGALDLDFHSAEFASLPNQSLEIYAATVQHDGKILVVGEFQFVDGLSRSSIVRLNADGTVDDTFAASLEFAFAESDARPARIADVALDRENRIVVAGKFNRLNGQLARPNGQVALWTHYWTTARLNPDGTIDSTFGPYLKETLQGLAPDVLATNESFGGGEITQIFPQADGNLMVGGYITLNTCGGGLGCLDIFLAHSFVARMYGEPPTNSFEFTAAQFVGEEADGDATITVRRLGDTSSAASVHYATHNGSALAGEDYQEPSGELFFAPLQMSNTFTIPLVNDTAGEWDETLLLTLTNATGVQVISRPTTQLRIADDDPPETRPFWFRSAGITRGFPVFTVFGPVGATYALEFKVNLNPSEAWSETATFTLTNTLQTIVCELENLDNEIQFYRLRRVAP